MRILVLGAGGMLGNAMVRVMSEAPGWEVHGTLRTASALEFFPDNIRRRLYPGIDVESHEALARTFEQVRPDVAINCIGLVKQFADSGDILKAVPVNAILPHRLAWLCDKAGARLVHVSTDCVFSGAKGGYTEDDPADAQDVYGKSKFMGEVSYPRTITLRTSIIGHELQGAHGLIGWFLAQGARCKGFTHAIFSGLPTVELARVIRDFVIPRPALSGVYHVAARPISKYDLLKLVAAEYGKVIEIVPDDALAIDRSLNAERFKQATGYVAPEWPDLIRLMHTYK